MISFLVGVSGQMAGQRIPLGRQPLTIGRSDENDVVLTDPVASRQHAELRRDGDGYVVRDRGSGNGTLVNGVPVTEHRLQAGDVVTIGEEVLRFEVAESPRTGRFGLPDGAPGVLRVTVAGGGPVGLAFALLLDHLMGPRVDVTVHDGRWRKDGDRIVWNSPDEGTQRRLQTVTVQSRQFRKLPQEVQDRLFQPGRFSEMWPMGPDSIEGFGPRNIKIAWIEDALLELAGEKRDRIRLVPTKFDPAAAGGDLARRHVLAICEGGRSSTRDHFADRFGVPDPGPYSLDGTQLQDMVLGLKVKSRLSDPMSVLLTVAQNRFLLNSLRGEGFLNMRLTAQETQEAVGISPVKQEFSPCIQSAPCVLERGSGDGYWCEMHRAFFLPALLNGSTLWARVQDGLRMFDVPPEDLTAITGFRLDMVQRPRYTAQLFQPTATTPGTYGFLLGDAANAIHFWPGRGLNSGLASAISLARCLATVWRDGSFRDADFTRHEAVMSMLQYRHKTRAWRQMVTPDAEGRVRAIKDLIAQGIDEGERGAFDEAADRAALLDRLARTRARLADRLEGLPDDDQLRAILDQLSGSTIHTLLVSQAWDSGTVGGEEVDVDWLLPEPAAAAAVPEPREAATPAAAPAAAAPRGWT